MDGIDKVFFFLFLFFIILFIFIFIIFLLFKTNFSKPIHIKSSFSNLFFNARFINNNLFLSSDGNPNDFFSQWLIESDPDLSGAITLRNAFSHNYIYPTVDNFFSIDLTERLGTNSDSNGWFYIISGTNKNSIRLQSFNDDNLYLIPVNFQQYTLLQLNKLPDNINLADYIIN